MRSTHRAVVTKAQAVEIYLFAQAAREAGADPLQGGNSARLAKKYGVSPKAIRDIWNRRTWTQEMRHLWAAHEQPMVRYKKLPASARLAVVVAGSGPMIIWIRGARPHGMRRPAEASVLLLRAFFSPRQLRRGHLVHDSRWPRGPRRWARPCERGRLGPFRMRDGAACMLVLRPAAAAAALPRVHWADGWGAAGGGRGGQHGEALGYFRAGAGAGAAGAEWDGPTGLLPVDAAGDSDPFHADWPHW